ncbi:BamA/TamA family outer membrane protein, partial [bacterium]|nr:BamA/TamA family outer membrane protein [bacterium]
MRRLLHIVILLAVAQMSLAGTLRKIRFPGVRAFSTAELSHFLGLSKGDSLHNLPEHLRALEDSLIAADYLFAHVDSVQIDTLRRKRLMLSVYVNLGKLSHVGQIRWQGDSLFVSPYVARSARIQAGAVFRWAALHSDIAEILSDMGNHGSPFTRVTILGITPYMGEEHIVDVTLRIQKGPQANVNFLEFTGNRLTKSDLLERETRLRPGVLYSEIRAARARRYLQRLPYIAAVQNPEIVFNPQGQTGLAFAITEAPSTRIDMVAGYLPGVEEGEKGVLTGLVDLSFLNLFGTGRRALVHWDRPNRSIQTIQLEYEEPWVAKMPLSLAVGFGQRIEDTLYVDRNVHLRATVTLTEALQVWGQGQFKEVIPDSITREVLGLPATRTRGLEAGFIWDTRDWPLNPRSGAMFSTFGGVGWRRVSAAQAYGGESQRRQNSAGVDAEVALEVLPRWVFDVAFHGKALESNEPEILLPDLYRLGGARSLRGYREEQFYGSRIGWMNLELRYLLGGASRVFGFVDGGAY